MDAVAPQVRRQGKAHEPGLRISRRPAGSRATGRADAPRRPIPPSGSTGAGRESDALPPGSARPGPGGCRGACSNPRRTAALISCQRRGPPELPAQAGHALLDRVDLLGLELLDRDAQGPAAWCPRRNPPASCPGRGRPPRIPSRRCRRSCGRRSRCRCGRGSRRRPPASQGVDHRPAERPEEAAGWARRRRRSALPQMTSQPSWFSSKKIAPPPVVRRLMSMACARQ